MKHKKHSPTRPHLRLVDTSDSTALGVHAGSEVPTEASFPTEPHAPASKGIGPYEQALALLSLAVTTGQRQYFLPQLRILQYCGFSRDQLAELMTLTTQVSGPHVMAHAAEVMDRYDEICRADGH
ncbi:hypothetical protein KMP13_17865 [Epibacterium ulvae]|uniref:hypothetical protein n=1 Tax=Epibacterium ulvae TaxID=1156985 RepID=UPI001BFC498B|nr:hypothetical protein [Epibacterium ulvae]MBT8155696.1 hypothetical protein [Epibacterium ulvae]